MWNRIVVSLVFFLGSALTALPASAQSNSCSYNAVWSVSGFAGIHYGSPGDDPSWQAYIAQAPAPPTCTYTWVGSNYSGYCAVYEYSCPNGTSPPSPSAGPNETAPGPTCPACGNPISLTTGNTWIQQADVGIPGLGGGLRLIRTWNSVWPGSQSAFASGMFGLHWRSNFEERIFMGSDNSVKYARGDGSFWSFDLISGSSAWQVVAPANGGATLTDTASYWIVTFKNGEKRQFGKTSGSLAQIIDRNGNTTQLSYDGLNRLMTVTDPASRHLSFTYASGSSYLVTGVSSDVGLSLSYTYDAQGRLLQVTKPDQSTINFEFDVNSFISAVKDSSGKILEAHTYDSSGRGLSSSRANGVESVTVSYQ